MKQYLYVILFGCFALSSCKKFLDEEVRSQIPDNYMNTLAGFEAGVKACYFPLRTHYGTERGMTLTVWGTDTYTMGRGSSFKYYNQYTNQLDPRGSYMRDTWNDLYIGINTCNAVISRAGDVPGLSEAVKKVRLAEARFLRAHYYFLLVQQFGEIHISLDETKGVVTAASRAPISDVYQVIVDDLEASIADLPATQGDYGRATKPAAEHMLARVLLTRATSEAAEATDYARAADLAVGVINNYNFSLLSNFADVFAQGAGERNSEVIWSVQFTKDPITNGGGNNSHLYFLMEYDILPGMVRDIANGRPFIRYAPTKFTTDTLFADRENDSRYEASFVHVYYCNKPGTYNVNNKTVTMKVGDTAIWLPGYKLTPEEKASKNFLVIEPDGYTQNRYLSLKKFLDTQRPEVNTAAGSRDFLAFRLAETYLIAAEALMYTGDPTAVDYVNAVRVRAATIGSTPGETLAHQEAMKIPAADLDIDFILDERGRELLGEQHRWFDLVRTGKLVERVRKHNPDGGPNIKDIHVRRPIPQDQIDRTKDGETTFPQNDGY